MFQNVQQIQDFIRQNGIAFLDFKMIDLRGRWKHLSIPAARFNEDIMTHGIGFDGSNYGYAQVERSDMVFLPDITTAVVDPFVKAPTLTMIGDVMVIDHPANRPFDQYPRNVAKSAIAHMQALGVADEMIIGPEYEFHVFDGMTRTVRPDAVGYRLQCSESVWSAGEFPNNGFHTGPHDGYHADLPGDRTFDLRNQICLELAKWGVDVKYHHHEVGGSGQLEIEVELGEMTRLADATMAAKYVIRNTAAANGMTATLMPKPIYGRGRQRHARTHASAQERSARVLRSERLWPAQPHGHALHRRPADARPQPLRHHEPQHEFLQAPHPRLRGPCHHRLCHGEPQRRRAHPGLC